jgi:hypothetical protein
MSGLTSAPFVEWSVAGAGWISLNSGTSLTFAGLPNGIAELRVICDVVTHSGDFGIRLGTTSDKTSEYTSTSNNIKYGQTYEAYSTDKFRYGFECGSLSANIYRQEGNNWLYNARGRMKDDTRYNSIANGELALNGELQRVTFFVTGAFNGSGKIRLEYK